MTGFSVIVEGLDNTGKDTLIKGLSNHYNNMISTHIHYGSIKQKSKEESIDYSQRTYDNMVKTMNFQSVVLNNVVFVNRSHLGELVYAPLYRGYDGDFALSCEKQMTMDRTFLIVLSDNPENLIARDDGLSHSTDIEFKKKEIELFQQAFKKSTIKHKYMININGHTIEQVFEKVLDFIEYKRIISD